MPIYVYRCNTCGKIFEEIQKVDDAAPETPTEPCPSAHVETNGVRACQLERQLTIASHRFRNELSSEGRAGYTRQGDVMLKQHRGKTGDTYGTDRAGRS